MDAADFMNFMVYESIEPFHDRRGDIQTGMICSILANINRTKRSDKLYNPMDFVPKWDAEPVKQPQTPQQQFAMMKMIQGFQEARGNPKVKPS